MVQKEELEANKEEGWWATQHFDSEEEAGKVVEPYFRLPMCTRAHPEVDGELQGGSAASRGAKQGRSGGLCNSDRRSSRRGKIKRKEARNRTERGTGNENSTEQQEA